MMNPNENVSPAEQLEALDPAVGSGVPEQAPHDAPAPAIAEPVLLGAGVSAAAVVTTLIAAGVPWYGAVGLAVVLVLVAAWQRQQVTPYR